MFKRYPSPFGPPSPGVKAIKIAIALIVIAVVSIGIATYIWPDKVGKFQAPGVQAQDVACTEGCKTSQNPDACYQGCMFQAGRSSPSSH